MRSTIVTADFYEREYNARASIPEHAQIFADWADRSAQARAALAGSLDVSYGPVQAHKLDIFPAQGTKRPILIFIHGGWWRSLDKNDFSFIAPPLVGEGVTVVSVNYTLAPYAGITEIVDEVRRACAWVWQHAPEFGGNREQIHLAGHSAGGHLTAMMLTTDWQTVYRGMPRDAIKSAIAVSGLYDLAPVSHADFVNVDLKLTEQSAKRISPIYLRPASPAPLHLAAGELESNEFRRQTDLIATAWCDVCTAPLSLRGRHHLAAMEDFVGPDGALFPRLIEMTGRAT